MTDADDDQLADWTLAERALQLQALVRDASASLNGRYRFTLTGSVVTVSDGPDWAVKVVTLPDGETKRETSLAIRKAIDIGWYVPVDDGMSP
jgi:tagatose-1,6-bisphosphate aldolase non-catalytic subunit AgaZ/GatZ